MTASLNLKADLRQALGSPDSRRIRKENKIPAVIHDRSEKNINIAVDGLEFEKEYFKGNVMTTSFKIDVAGKSINAVANKIDLDPISDKPIHIDFIKFNKGEKVKAQVKIAFTNKEKCPGLKKGGFLHIVARKIELLCKSDAIPESIGVDIGEMKVGDKLRGKDLKLTDGAELSKKGQNRLIASIIGRASKEEATPAADAAVGENKDEKAATPAGAAKPAAAGAAKAPAGGKDAKK